MVDVLWQLSESEKQRSQARYQCLQLIVHVAESGSTAIEPVYRAVFASLQQVCTTPLSVRHVPAWAPLRWLSLFGVL